MLTIFSTKFVKKRTSVDKAALRVRPQVSDRSIWRTGPACVFVRDGTIPVLMPSLASVQAASRHRVCPSFWHADEFPLDSWTCIVPASLAHIVFHSLCAKPSCALPYPCRLKNRRSHFFLAYQWLRASMCVCAQFCPQKMWRNLRRL